MRTNLLQLSMHPQTSVRFSVISGIVLEVNMVAEQKQALLVTIFLLFFFISWHCPQPFYCPPLPYRCSSVLVKTYSTNVVF